MSLKEINDFGNLYSNIKEPDTELAEDILATIIVDMIREGYSAEATMSYLDEASHVDICDKYEEAYERVEDFILECEYAEYFGEDTTVLFEELELLDEKFKKGAIEVLKKQGQKLLNKTGNALKGLGKPNKKQLELIKKATEGNKGKPLSKWQQGKYNKAIKKGKSSEIALKFANTGKEPSVLGKASNLVKGVFNKKWKRDAALVGGTVAGLDAISKSDKAKEEADKIKDGTSGEDKDKYKEGGGKSRPISQKQKAQVLNTKTDDTKVASNTKTNDTKVTDAKTGDTKVGGSTTSGTIAQQDHHQSKVIADFKKQQEASKKAKERADWLSKTSGSPAAKAGLSDDQRWSARQKHVKFQKDNNRGEFKAKTKEVPSKFAANKDKPTFQRRDAKLVAKGLKPPTYTKKVKVQENVGPRIINQQIKRTLKNIPAELAPAALMSGVLNKAKGLAGKNTFIKGAVDGATGTTRLLRKMVQPPKVKKPTYPNVKSTERISQGGALAVRKPGITQKIKDTAGDVAKKVGETVKGTAEKLKKVKLKNPIPKPVRDYGVPIGIGVGIHKALNREDYEPFELVLDYLIETEQVDSMDEALYVMMEMDPNTIHGIVTERTMELQELRFSPDATSAERAKIIKDLDRSKTRPAPSDPRPPKGPGTDKPRPPKGPGPSTGKPRPPKSSDGPKTAPRPPKSSDGPRGGARPIDENIKASIAKKGVSKIMKAAKKMPEYVRDSIKRQYKAGSPGAAPYTIEDKKNVLNWYKNSK